MPLSKEVVIAALRQVQEPEIHKDLVTLNLVRDIAIDGPAATIAVELLNPATREIIERQIIAAVKQSGAEMVRVVFSQANRGVSGSPGAGSGNPQQQAQQQSPLPQVKTVIAVGAGKGGVGKSTIALNLAIGLQRTGAAVGLMDGDIYGPSMPTMLGIRGVTPRLIDNKIIPHHVHGIHAITIGSLVESDQPLIWRGPKAHGAFKQLLLDNTDWPPLDYLIVDLPPGTGDVPLTLGQLLPLTGSVIVATPQQVALDDAIRAVKMFQQLGAPVLGLVENMSYFVGDGGVEHDIFGRGGTRRASEQLKLPFLGELPMFTELRVNSDEGRPHANFEGSPKLRESLEGIVANLLKQVEEARSQRGPTLEII